jgi:hypothetical protein
MKGKIDEVALAIWTDGSYTYAVSSIHMAELAAGIR